MRSPQFDRINQKRKTTLHYFKGGKQLVVVKQSNCKQYKKKMDGFFRDFLWHNMFHMLKNYDIRLKCLDFVMFGCWICASWM